MTTGDDSPVTLNSAAKQSIARAPVVSAHISAVVASDRTTGEFARALAQGAGPVMSDQMSQFATRVRWYVEQLGNIFTVLKSFIETTPDPRARAVATVLLYSSLQMVPETRFPGDDSLGGYWPYAWGAYEILLVTNHLDVGQEMTQTHQMVRGSASPGALPTIDPGLVSRVRGYCPGFTLSAAEVIAPFQPGPTITSPAGAPAPAPASPWPQVTTQPPQNGPNLPPAQLRKTPFPTLAKAEAVLLEGIVATANLGGYLLSYGMGQLMVSVYGASPRIGGSYRVGNLPVGEWFVLTDRHGSLLPVAVQKIREDAYQVRVDSAPLQGLRAVNSMPGY